MSRFFPCRMCAVLAIFAVVSTADAQTIHDVDQIGVTFDPATVSVQVGDTIRWHRTTSTHTVTSGGECTYDEMWFDLPLNSANPVVEWVVPDNAPTSIPYFCRPHCLNFGMEGLITVSGACEGDFDGDGAVMFSDLLEILSAWGPCDSDCSLDLDNNNTVDFGDLVLLLSNWGPCDGTKG